MTSPKEYSENLRKRRSDLKLRTIRFQLRYKHFDQVLLGEKKEEFRLRKPYWIERIEGKTYDQIIIQKGRIPGDEIVFPWRGYRIITITHPEFGKEPVEVFAIKLWSDDPEKDLKEWTEQARRESSPDLQYLLKGTEG